MGLLSQISLRLAGKFQSMAHRLLPQRRQVGLLSRKGKRMSLARQQQGIYIHGDKVIGSPVHGGLVPAHGGKSPVHGDPNLDTGGALTAPTLSWDSGTNEAGRNPTFTMTGLLGGDIPQLQVDDDSGFAAPIYGDQTLAAISDIDAALGTLNFDTIPTLAYSTAYWARARYQRGGIWSSWSNVPTKTMDAAAAFSLTRQFSSTHAATVAGARTFSNVALGAADLTRKLVCQVAGYFGGGSPVLRVYDGVGSGTFTDYNPIASGSYTPAAGSNINFAFEIPYASLTATDIAIVGSSNDCTLEVWSLIGSTTSSKVALTQSSMADAGRLITPTTPINGKTVVFGCIFVGAGTPTWANATGDTADGGSEVRRLNAYRTAAGSPVSTQVSVTGYGTAETSLLALSYGP